MSEKRHEVIRQVSDVYQKELNWVTFFREVLGVKGVVRQMFPDSATLVQFERSPEYHQILQMLQRLREKDKDNSAASSEPTRVITVRLPESLHEALKAEAHDYHTSMNKLCISKLLQVLDEIFVEPTDGKQRDHDGKREHAPERELAHI